jgi:hypothetical protein
LVKKWGILGVFESEDDWSLKGGQWGKQEWMGGLGKVRKRS